MHPVATTGSGSSSSVPYSAPLPHDPRRCAHSWLGQALYGLVALGFGSLFPLGLIVLALFLLPSLLAARIAIWMAGRGGVAAKTRDD